MKKALKKLVVGLIAAATLGASACSYAGMAAYNGKLYVARNDAFLFGLLRGVYACVDQGGTLVCSKAGKP